MQRSAGHGVVVGAATGAKCCLIMTQQLFHDKTKLAWAEEAFTSD